MIKKLKTLFKPLESTIIHPQWLSFRDNVLRSWLKQVSNDARILDVGCFDQWPRRYLPKTVNYIGLDYYETATQLYQSDASIYGSGECLPFAAESFDTVIMFDVLEHIPKGEKAVEEAYRVLSDGGEALVQIPFLYPIHDAPLDFRRPTMHGLKAMFESAGFEAVEMTSRGKPIETACLLTNIALASSVTSLLKSKWVLLAVALSPLVILIGMVLNTLGWLASCQVDSADLMPFSYQAKFRKASLTRKDSA